MIPLDLYWLFPFYLFFHNKWFLFGSSSKISGELLCILNFLGGVERLSNFRFPLIKRVLDVNASIHFTDIVSEITTVI